MRWSSHVALAGEQGAVEQIALGVVDQEMLIAMRVIVAVEERELLLAVRRIVGGVQVEREMARLGEAALVAADKVIDQDSLGRAQPAFAGAILKTRERRLAGEVGAVRASVADSLEERLRAQRGGVVAILVALADGEDSLAYQVEQGMLDEQRIAPLDERARQLFRQPQRIVELPQQQHAGVVTDVAVVEGDGHPLRAEESEGGLRSG